MTLTANQLADLFETLVEGGATTERQRSSEVALNADPTGRLLLVARDLWRQPPETAPPADLAPRAMAALPDLPPGGRPVLADLILAGWTDLATREAIRRDPRAVLAAHGLSFPEHIAVEVVLPAEARLPQRDRIALPLPAPGRGPVARAEAQRQLAATELGWLWGPPWARGGSVAELRAVPWVPRRARRWLAPALAAAAVVVVVAWLAVWAVPGGGDLSGAASNRADLLSALALGAGLVAALVAAWAWRRRR